MKSPPLLLRVYSFWVRRILQLGSLFFAEELLFFSSTFISSSLLLFLIQKGAVPPSVFYAGPLLPPPTIMLLPIEFTLLHVLDPPFSGPLRSRAEVVVFFFEIGRCQSRVFFSALEKFSFLIRSRLNFPPLQQATLLFVVCVRTILPLVGYVLLVTGRLNGFHVILWSSFTGFSIHVDMDAFMHLCIIPLSCSEVSSA